MMTRCLSRWVAIAGVLATMLGLPINSRASEGGGSVYLQGTYGDFAAAVFGPSGFYYRNDLVYYDASIGARPLGGVVNAGVDQRLWMNLSKLAWLSDARILGGRFGIGVVLPIVFDVNVNAQVAGPGFGQFRGATSGGIGDPFIVPQLNWASGVHSTTFALGISAPWGQYDADRAVNLSRNYWALDPAVTHTYLDQQGWELSFTAGVLFNERNSDTHYTTGDEFHLDWLAGYHLSQTFAIALNGYWYQQFTNDKGNIPPFLNNGFRGRGVGIGPAAMKTLSFWGHDVTFILKWLHDVDSKNRLDGDLVMLSAALKLGPVAGASKPSAASTPPPTPVITPPPPPAPPVAPSDSDGDGVPDTLDLCPNTPHGDRVDSQGCSCDVTVQLHFEFDSAQITADDKTALNRLAQTMRRLKSPGGEVGGYTDNRGTRKYNLSLSKRRAQAVVDYLISQGISGEQLIAVGHGDEQPIGDNSNEDGRAQNRRVVLRRTDCGPR